MVTAFLACGAPAQAQGAPPGDGTVGQGSRPTGPHIAPNPVPYEGFAAQLRHPANTMPPYTSVVLSEQELADIYAYLVSIPPLLDPKAAAILDH
jgi:mono/diheme cytochrome c family protein